MSKLKEMKLLTYDQYEKLMDNDSMFRNFNKLRLDNTLYDFEITTEPVYNKIMGINFKVDEIVTPNSICYNEDINIYYPLEYRTKYFDKEKNNIINEIEKINKEILGITE